MGFRKCECGLPVKVLIFLCFHVIIEMNKEDRGRSVHGWSSPKRVGSLSRIG